MALRPPGAGVNRRAKESRKRFISSPSVLRFSNHRLSANTGFLVVGEAYVAPKAMPYPRGFER